MERRLQYRIEEKDEGKTILAYLKEQSYSKAVVVELKKTKNGILKNGVWAYVNEVLSACDILQICLVESERNDKIIPIKYKLDILYEDEDLVVVNKPYHMPIHPSINNYENTLANAIMYYSSAKGETYAFRCINRLDKDTSGATILAKNLLSAAILSKQVKERRIHRTYVAFAEGVTKPSGTITLPIGRVAESIIKRQVDLENGKQAVTHYQTIKQFEVDNQVVSMIKLRLETGRTHQIRVHLNAIGHPLLGDQLYNPENHMMCRQALHSAELEFTHPITGQRMNIQAPLYEDMRSLLTVLE